MTPPLFGSSIPVYSRLAVCAVLGGVTGLFGGAGAARAALQPGEGIFISGQILPLGNENANALATGAGYSSSTGLYGLNAGSGSYTTNPSTNVLGLTSAGLTLNDVNASLSERGSLATGAFHLYDQSELIQNANNLSNLASSEDNWSMTMTDGLTFHVQGGGSATLTVRLALDGGVTLPPLADSYSQTIGLTMRNASLALTALLANDGGNGIISEPFSHSGVAYGWNGMSLTDDTVSSFVWTGTITVQDGEYTGITLSDGGADNQGPTSDFLNTLQLSFLNLPAGVSYTSDSGTFLTGGAQDVPEPAPLTLLAVGLAGLAWVRRAGARA